MVLLCHACYPLFVHVCTQFGVYIWMIFIAIPRTVKNYLLMALFGQGRQRCRLETSFDPTWTQERILKIIEALGRKAKLSIFREFDRSLLHSPQLTPQNNQWELRFGYLIRFYRIAAKVHT